MPSTEPIELEPPKNFQIARHLKPGRYPLLQVFPGLDHVAPFRAYPCSPKVRRELAGKSCVEIVAGKGEWMYVAPRELPADASERWKPLISAEDCVVIGRGHLRYSPAIVLYLDILHELYHVIQRKAGRELWDPQYSYVDRPTELEAYKFSVAEARRLKAPEGFIREYLRVEWVSNKEHRRLLRFVGVQPD